MKKLAVAMGTILFTVNMSLASERCKEQAELAVEVREDYKSYAEAEAVISKQLNALSFFSDTVTGIQEQGRLQQQLITAEEVFKTYKGIKGKALYQKVFNSCVTYEKRNAERAARQEARAAAKAAREKPPE